MILATKYIAGTLATLAVAVGALSFGHHSPVCPDEFGTDEAGSTQYLTATNKWTNDFFDAHPDASLKDWGEARYQFWVDNHCTAALEGYEQAKAGKVDPERMQMIEDVLRDATQP
jgi:hypothetical protein